MTNSIISIYTPSELIDLFFQALSKSKELEMNKTHEINNDETLLTLKQAADFLKVSQSTVYNWKNNGTLVYHRIARKVLFKVADLKNAVRKVEGLRLDF